MFICFVLLILLLPVTVLPLALQSFSASELLNMGICLENPQSPESPDAPTRPINSVYSCPSCLSAGLPG